MWLEAEKTELSFRIPMAVTEIVHFSRLGAPYPRCPRCRSDLDREYMSFCDRCGQRLDWTQLDRAIVSLIP